MLTTQLVTPREEVRHVTEQPTSPWKTPASAGPDCRRHVDIRAAGGEDSEDLRGARSDPGTKGPLLTVAESLVELCHTHVWKAEPVTGADDYLARRFPARC